MNRLLVSAAVCAFFLNAQVGHAQVGPTSGSSSLVISSTPITGGADTRVLFQDGTTIGESAGFTFSKGNGGTTSTLTIGGNANLLGDAANTLSMRNGASAQKLRLYQTFTDTSNGAWIEETWNGTTGILQTNSNGTGNAPTLQFGVNGTVFWQIDSGGVLGNTTDNTRDIGSSGANRPRNGFFGQELTARSFLGSGSTPGNTGSCAITSQAGGNTVGKFSASGACATGTVILGFAATATTGWACDAHDQTTVADAINQTASTTTSATFTATMANNDVVSFKCRGY